MTKKTVSASFSAEMTTDDFGLVTEADLRIYDVNKTTDGIPDKPEHPDFRVLLQGEFDFGGMGAEDGAVLGQFLHRAVEGGRARRAYQKAYQAQAQAEAHPDGKVAA